MHDIQTIQAQNKAQMDKAKALRQRLRGIHPEPYKLVTCYDEVEVLQSTNGDIRVEAYWHDRHIGGFVLDSWLDDDKWCEYADEPKDRFVRPMNELPRKVARALREQGIQHYTPERAAQLLERKVRKLSTARSEFVQNMRSMPNKHSETL